MQAQQAKYSLYRISVLKIVVFSSQRTFFICFTFPFAPLVGGMFISTNIPPFQGF
jgi:hypothetical protein